MNNLFGTSGNLPELRERVRRFVDEECIPRERNEHAHDVCALDEAIAVLRPVARSMGVYAPQLPAAYGGLDLSWRDRAVVFEEAGRSYLAPGAMNCAPPDQPNMINLMRDGTEDQRRRYLVPLAAGEIRSCFAMTEPAPGAGSDPSMLLTKATRRGERWVIDGHKWYTSGAIGAAFAIVLTQTEQGPTLFIVDAKHPGFQIVRDIPSIGAYAIGGQAEVRLVECEVGDDAILGELGRGFEYAQVRLQAARISHCMRYIGRARRALEFAEAYVLQRESFGQRLAELQQMQAMVADSHIDLQASRLMALCGPAGCRSTDEGRVGDDKSVRLGSCQPRCRSRVANDGRARHVRGHTSLPHRARVATISHHRRRIGSAPSNIGKALLARSGIEHDGTATNIKCFYVLTVGRSAIIKLILRSILGTVTGPLENRIFGKHSNP